MDEITIRTKAPKQVVDLTAIINDLIEKKEVSTGICMIFVKHTTCCLMTGEFESGLNEDYLQAIEKIFPQGNYQHAHDPSHTGEHVMSSLIGHDITLLVRDGRLVLGAWQKVLLIELSGPKDRQITIQIIKPVES